MKDFTRSISLRELLSEIRLFSERCVIYSDTGRIRRRFAATLKHGDECSINTRAISLFPTISRSRDDNWLRFFLGFLSVSPGYTDDRANWGEVRSSFARRATCYCISSTNVTGQTLLPGSLRQQNGFAAALRLRYLLKNMSRYFHIVHMQSSHASGSCLWLSECLNARPRVYANANFRENTRSGARLRKQNHRATSASVRS